MTKISQLIAVVKGVKSKAQQEENGLYHLIDKAPLFSGLSRKYLPKDEEGDRLPPESTLVQVKSEQVLDKLSGALTRLFDTVLTLDCANAGAYADVAVDGEVILSEVPVTYLLFLDRELEKVTAFVKRLPVLDPSEEWRYDSTRGVFATPPVQTTRTKKVPRNWVKAEATTEHPAQVEVYYEDTVAGAWETVKFSGALSSDRRDAILERVDKLRTAVKYAREEANGTEVTDYSAGEQVFDYLFAAD